MFTRVFTALIALVSLSSACYAAFAIFQTYSGPPQIFYNIVTDAGAACNGDVLTVTRNVTTVVNNSTVTVFNGPFINATTPAGDIGKALTIEGAGGGGGRYHGTITGVSGSVGATQTLTTTTNANTALTNVSTTVVYGTDDAPKFDTFNNWARANQGAINQVVLTIPAGKSCWFGTGTFNFISTFNAFAAGINNLIVEGTGATISSVGGQGFTLGGLGTCFQGLTATPGCSARIQTVSAGATQIQLTAASLAAGYISRFTVGRVVMLGGIDPQAGWDTGYGDPTNQYDFEWRTITNINVGTGVITLDRPLTNSYLSTWPQQNAGDQFHSDGGGPAAVWAMDASWETTVEYRGLTISQDGQTYTRGRNATFRGVTFTGNHAGIPTENETWSAITTNFGFADMETDKLVGTMLLDGISIAKITNQSTATGRLTIRNSTFTLGLVGGAQITDITDTTIADYYPGIKSYGNTVPGAAGATTCTRCNITTLHFDLDYLDNPSPSYFFKSGGVISFPNAADLSGSPQRAFIPGTNINYNVSGFGPVKSVAISALTQDPWPSITDNQIVTTNVTMDCSSTPKLLSVSPATPFVSGDVGKVIYIGGVGSFGGILKTWISAFNSTSSVTVGANCSTTLSGSSQTVQWGTSNTYATTNEAGGFPNTSSLSALPIGINGGHSWNFTCDTCTGDPNAVGASIQAGAAAAQPLGTYLKRTFTPSSVAAQGAMPARGKLVSLTVDVTQAFIGSGTSVLNPTGQFHNFTVNQATWASFDWFPAINLKQAGTRVITASGVTCNGVAAPTGCAGDSLGTAPPNAVWITNNIDPWTAGNFTGMTTPPTFTITIQTDQSP